jgi:hypothetical protein
MIPVFSNTYPPTILERVGITKESQLYQFCHDGIIKDIYHIRSIKNDLGEAIKNTNGDGWKYNWLANIWDYLDETWKNKQE